MSKKGENIYKRKDNRWEARYIKGYTAEGQARYGYCYAATYREAKEKVTAAKADLLNGLPSVSVNSKKRFYHYCDEWLRLKRCSVKESTYVKYMTNIEKHIKQKLGGCFAQGLSSLIVEEFTHDLLDKQALSPKTVRDILTLLRAILKYTQKQVPNMPLIEVVYPKDKKKEMRVLSRDEQKRLTHYLLSDMDDYKFGVLLALLTGLRIGEVCALRWKDVSLEDKLLCVSSTMQRLKVIDESTQHKTKIFFSDPKSNTSARQIPLTDYTVKLCKRREARNPSAFVLTGETDRYIEPRTLQYHLRRYTKDCGLTGVHFHVMRHTFATRCVEVGFEIKSLSEILGHTSPKFTLERYVHSSLELKRDNMNKLETIGY